MPRLPVALLVIAFIAAGCVGPPGTGGPTPVTTSTTTTLPALDPSLLRYEVISLTPDANGDGRIDRYWDGKWSTMPGGLPTDGKFAVSLDACELVAGSNTGVEQFVDGVVVGRDCLTEIRLAEGPHDWKVRLAGRGEVSRSIDVVHHLVVGLGDSYGSGEGADDALGTRAGWQDQNCHRAANAAQARAALAIERADDRSTVTFLHLACSGATIDEGILGEYPEPPGQQAVPAQVLEAAQLTAGWQVDALFLSIGGNDIEFSPVIKACGVFDDCATETRRVNDSTCEALTSLIRLTCDETETGRPLHDEVQEALTALPARYAALADCLSGTGQCTFGGKMLPRLGVDPSDVIQITYPDISTRPATSNPNRLRSPDGFGYCSRALRPPFRSGIAEEEFQWAREVVQQGRAGTTFEFRPRNRAGATLAVTADGLNTTIAANNARHGWTIADESFTNSRGHGYCAPDRWVTQIVDSFVGQGDEYGTFHPNIKGQISIGIALTDAATNVLSP
jgi:hypothetical protein